MENALPILKKEHVYRVCRPGTGGDTCRYLVAGAAGMECANGSSLAKTIDAKVANGLFTAKSINCSGPSTGFYDPLWRVGNKFFGVLYGLAIADALGSTNEFLSAKKKEFVPIAGMVGGGWLKLEPGEWTDDTAMALCLAESIVDSDGHDAEDQLRWYLKWYKENVFTSNDRFIDAGINTRKVIERFAKGGKPEDVAGKSAGNGCIMRIGPVSMMYAEDIHEAKRIAELTTTTTHDDPDARECASLFVDLTVKAIMDEDSPFQIREKVKKELEAKMNEKGNSKAITRTLEIALGTSAPLDPDGYCVNTLGAALWCLLNTMSFDEGALMAANLCGDADTTGAVYGQIAGAIYGLSGINKDWLDLLAKRELIERACTRLWYAFLGRRTEGPPGPS